MVMVVAGSILSAIAGAVLESSIDDAKTHFGVAAIASGVGAIGLLLVVVGALMLCWATLAGAWRRPDPDD